jgi:hypothetical protein
MPERSWNGALAVSRCSGLVEWFRGANTHRHRNCPLHFDARLPPLPSQPFYPGLGHPVKPLGQRE